jgi:hypothetical protein
MGCVETQTLLVLRGNTTQAVLTAVNILKALPPWGCLIWCTFVMYSKWDNYHFKSDNPVRIMLALDVPPFRGDVSFSQGETRSANDLL